METKNCEADLVVIGGGAAGVVAAITAAEAGIKNIILLEKGRNLGGAGLWAQGMYAIDSVLQRKLAENEYVSLKDELSDIMHYTAYLSDPVLTRKIPGKSGETVSWLLNHGIEMRADINHQLRHRGGRVYHRWGPCEGSLQHSEETTK